MNSLLIVSFCNFRYRRIALNWVRHLNNLDISNYLIISTDKKVFNFFLKKGIKTKLDPSWSPSHKAESGWRGRVKIIKDFIDDGVNILHSDLDAVWLKNPLHLIDDSDIVSSQGSFPDNVFKKLGFTFCMGWIFYRSNDRVMGLLNRILKFSGNFDDQRIFNEYLSTFPIKNLCDDNVHFLFGDLQVKVLSQNDIYRSPMAAPLETRLKKGAQSMVHHPVSLKSDDREQFLKKMKLWIND